MPLRKEGVSSGTKALQVKVDARPSESLKLFI